MKTYRFGLTCFVFAGICLLQVGCGMQPPPVQVPEKYMPKETPGIETPEKIEKLTTRPDINYINKRMSFYETRLNEWKELDSNARGRVPAIRLPEKWQDCGSLLTTLAGGYEKLHLQYMQEKGLASVEGKIDVDLWNVHDQDLKYFESGCESVIGSVRQMVGGEAVPLVETPQDLLARYASEGKYEEAIEIYRDLVIQDPQAAEIPAVKRIYGMALLRTKRIDAATKVLPTALEPLNKANPDTWGQRRLVADLYLGTGQLQKAQTQYQILAEFFASDPLGSAWDGVDLWVNDQVQVLQPAETPGGEQGLTIFMTVMREFILFDGKRLQDALTRAVKRLERIFPESKYTQRSRQILWKAEEQVKVWVRTQLYGVDELVTEKKYDAARQILEDLMAGELPDDLRMEVKKVKDDVVLAQGKERKTQEIIDDRSVESLLAEAMNLFGLRRYNEAITAFTYLLGTEHDEQAREKIAEASDIAAKDMRRKAAKLFVRATKSGTIEQKKELLIESWQMMNEIAAKYPMASTVTLEKALQNLQVIEEKMREIDPTMLDNLGEVVVEEEQERDQEETQENPSQKIVEEEIL